MFLRSSGASVHTLRLPSFAFFPIHVTATFRESWHAGCFCERSGATLCSNQVHPVGTARPAGRTIRFGVFEVDLSAGELRKQGIKIKLREQPFQVLRVLLENSGQ